VKFAAIADWADSDTYPVDFMCAQLGVSRSGFYAWRGRGPSQRASTDAGLLVVIKAAFERLRGNPGVRRMHAELQTLGYQLSRKRVWRLMKTAGLQGRHPRAWKRTTVPGDSPVPAPDLLGRNFTAERPQPALVRRHHLPQDLGRLGLPGHRHRPEQPRRRRLGARRPHAHRPGHRRPGHGTDAPPAPTERHLSQ